MLKTLKTINAQSKEKFHVPTSVQQVLPIQDIWEDGIFQTGKTQYTASYSFSDINYLIAGLEERKKMYGLYQDLLGALGPGAIYKITTNNRSINMSTWAEKTLLKPRGDALDEYVAEYNNMLKEKISEAAGIEQEHYITVTVFKPNIQEARSYFNRIWPALQSAFGRLGSKLQPLNAIERLRIFHDFFRQGEDTLFHMNFNETYRRGHSPIDSICPSSFKNEADHIKIGTKFARVLFVSDYASYVSDDLIARLSELPRTMMISVDVISIPTEETATMLQQKRDGVESAIGKWQNRQNRNNNFSATIPYHLRRQQEEMEEFMDDVIKNDQGLNIVVMTIIHTADTLEQLNSDTDRINAIRDCKLLTATYQQLDGMVTSLPFGVCRIAAQRSLLTRCLAAISMPFRVQEIQDPGGIWYGVNALTRNLIICDRRKLQNQGAFILGVPGAGKSMIAKEQIIFLYLTTDDTILINDPEGEYSQIVRILGGTVVKIQAGGEHYLNAMDMESGYGEKGGIADKSEYIQTLFEQMTEAPLTAQEQSIIDRCVLLLYHTRSAESCTLTTLRELLLQQPEPESRSLALTLERFTAGSLDVFAHETNVDMSNRLISFDLSEMGKQLRPIAQLTITDILINRVNVNSRAGRRTHIFTDESQEFFRNDHSASFFDSAWRQWRKRNGYPTAITQNVSVLLDNEKSRAMLSNSETVVLLNQSDADQQRLSNIFQIPDEQIRYVRGAESGCGLLLYGDRRIPFINRFPSDLNLYDMMTTKPEEGFHGGA